MAKTKKTKYSQNGFWGFGKFFNLTTGIQKPFQEYFLFYSSD